MATKTSAKSKTKGRVAAKPAARKKSASAARTSTTDYTQLTWALMVVWLALIAVFLGLVVTKLYLNN